jgi:hypothetical protein
MTQSWAQSSGSSARSWQQQQAPSHRASSRTGTPQDAEKELPAGSGHVRTLQDVLRCGAGKAGRAWQQYLGSSWVGVVDRHPLHQLLPQQQDGASAVWAQSTIQRAAGLPAGSVLWGSLELRSC